MPTVETAFPMALNLAIAASLATSVTLLCSRFISHLPQKHAILVAGLLTCLLAPLAVGLGSNIPLGLLPELIDQKTPLAVETDFEDKFESNTPNSTFSSDGVTASVRLSEVDIDTPSVSDGELSYDLPIAANSNPESNRSILNQLLDRAIVGIFFLICWVAGTLFFAILRLRDMMRARRLLAACVDNQKSMLAHAYQTACQELEIRRIPRLLISQQITSPIVFGFANPKVILPVELQENFSEKQIAAMLMHELAHVSRCDQWVVALQMITTTIYWWNPLVWISSRKIAETRELICDDVVLNSKASPRDYAWSLVTMAERLMTMEKNMASIGISQASGGELESRIRRLLEIRADNVPTRLSTRSLLGCLAFGTSLMFAMLLAQIPPLNSVAAIGFPKDQQTGKGNSATNARGDSDFPERRIAGIVVDPSGNAVAGARVELKNQGATPQETDAAGRFDFTTRLANRHLESAFIMASDPKGETKAFYRFNPLAADFQMDNLRIQLEETRTAEVLVVDDQDKPIDDANVAFAFDFAVRLDDFTTDENGRLAITIPESEKIKTVAAWKDHEGLDYRLYTLTAAQQADMNKVEPLFPEAAPERLVLSGASPVSVTTVDEDDQPISGLTVYPWLMRKPEQPDQLNLSITSKQLYSVTNEEGIASFDWMPAWQQDNVVFWQLSTEYERIRRIYNPATDDSQLELRLRRLVPIRGRVVDAAGNPMQGIEIQASGVDYSTNDFFAFVATDANGEYEIKAAANKLYLLTVVDEKWGAEPRTGFAVYPAQPVENMDFQLREGTKLSGRLIDETTGKPLANRIVTVIQKGSMLDQLPDVSIPNSENSRRMYVQPRVPRWVETNSDGEYEFTLGDGTYSIRPPEPGRIEEVKIAGEPSIEMSFSSKTEDKKRLLGLVTRKRDGAPVENAELYAIAENVNQSRWRAKADQSGNFLVMRQPADTVVRAYSAGGKLSGFAELGADKENVIVELEPVGHASGRIVSEKGEPLAGQKLRLFAKVGFIWHRTYALPKNSEPQLLYTDDEGRFELDNLVPGFRYKLVLEQSQDQSTDCFEFTAQAGKKIDLGAAKPR